MLRPLRWPYPPGHGSLVQLNLPPWHVLQHRETELTLLCRFIINKAPETQCAPLVSIVLTSCCSHQGPQWTLLAPHDARCLCPSRDSCPSLRRPSHWLRGPSPRCSSTPAHSATHSAGRWVKILVYVNRMKVQSAVLLRLHFELFHILSRHTHPTLMFNENVGSVTWICFQT